MANDKSALLRITIIFFVIQMILMFALFRQGQYSYTRSVMATTCFWAIYTFLEARYKFYMNAYVRVMIVLTLLLDGFFGNYLDLYTTSSIFDKILHVVGTYAFSLFAYVLVAQLLKQPVSSSFKFILVVSLGVSLGGFYEILEFLTDAFSHPIPISQPSLLDTDLDLIGDVVGAVLAAIHVISRTFINLTSERAD